MTTTPTSDAEPSTHLVDIALRGGLIHPDALRIVDLTGADADPHAFVAALKAAKPHFFVRQARDLTPAEREAAIRDLNRAAETRSGPLPHAGKRMSEMTAEEQAEFIRAYRKKFPGAGEGMSLPRKRIF